jgi:DNA-binding NarL/FixJ family response regulator
VFVTDISMPLMDGLQAASILRDSGCRAKIIFLTIHQDWDFVRAALAAGACGYVTKSKLSTDLIPAIHEVLLGHIYVSPSIAATDGPS